MTTLHFDVLVQNYSCLRIVSYFTSKIGLGQKSPGCGFWGSAIWRLCILTFWPKTIGACEQFHIFAVKQGLGKIPPVADFEDQLHDDFVFLPFGPELQLSANSSVFQQWNRDWAKFHWLRILRISYMMNLHLGAFGPKLPLFAKRFIFQRRNRDRAKCHWLWILGIRYMMTLYFDVLARNYSCLRIVPYFSSGIGIGRNSTGCGF